LYQLIRSLAPAQVRRGPTDFTEAAYLRARRGQGRPDADRESMFAMIALREIRESIRNAGLRPPQLPGELAWIDGLES
jgi:hypothetical protein